ncbi:SubName: Full=Uncharacterized protein {ECO:0000313/EMBL:CCA70947.1} [Serendipita indica DSM 11827]|nr:SubName: Full=Uncharacterized protein {ECO:0000313/EMBL:CCA70947.1} [Serendipita indica DSM 11827]
MPAATTTKSEKTLKGKEAEDRVVGYLREMNRPFGAGTSLCCFHSDISANIKGIVSKPATQKILLAAAERGEITQKTYGKVQLFVANQADLEDLPENKRQELSTEIQSLAEQNRELNMKNKALQQGSFLYMLSIDWPLIGTELARIRSMPTDADLLTNITQIRTKVNEALSQLEPLRQGAPMVTQEELCEMETSWKKYRAEWILRKKIFKELWCSFTDQLPPSESQDLASDLGIEFDTEEHVELEKLLGPGAMTSYRHRA